MGKFLIGLVAMLLFGLFTPRAAAQGVTVTISSVTRAVPEGTEPAARFVTAINRADCLADERFDMTLAFGTAFPLYGLEIWAGVDCDQLSARNPPTATCWQVYSGSPTNIVRTVEVSVRDLLWGRTRAGLPGEDGDSTNEASCEPVSSVVAPQTLAVYAMLVDANLVVAGDAIWKTTYKLSTPPPPDIASVASGDRQLSVNLAPLADTNQQIDGVQLFCDPAPGDPNAAASAQTAMGDGGVLVPTCSPSAELVPGADGATLQHLRCGSADRIALTALAKDLDNGVSYNVAVASVDTYGNVGPLSTVACQVPQARTAHSKVQACAFAGPVREQSGSCLACLIAISAALSRRHLGRGRPRATVN